MKWMIAAITSLLLALNSKFEILNSKQYPNTNFPNDKAGVESTSPALRAPSPKSGEGKQKYVLLSVPFTSQAPDGNWKNPKFQDGCEESAILMASCAVAQFASCPVTDGKIDKDFAKKKIGEIWDWQVENYGEARDTSAEDTAERILGGYFREMRYKIVEMRYYEEIKTELARGNVVIVPVDGRGLNPNYKAPGPERHMILIRGYDDSMGEFITNDAGTRRGEKYRYKYQKLFDAIRDYPSGSHVTITGVDKKMIVVQ